MQVAKWGNSLAIRLLKTGGRISAFPLYGPSCLCDRLSKLGSRPGFLRARISDDFSPTHISRGQWPFIFARPVNILMSQVFAGH